MIRILGGGLWGGLFAWILHHKRPDVEFELFEQHGHLGGNHTWSFHQSDLTPENFELLRPLISHQWPGYEVHFPAYSRKINLEYCSILSTDFDRIIRQTVPENKIKLNQKAFAHENVIQIDTRGKTFTSPCGYQKFVGLEVEIEEKHNLKVPILMDARIPQIDGFRFMYVLPLSETKLLIEDTRYSDSSALDQFRLKELIHEYARNQNWKIKHIVREEMGSLPIPLTETKRIFNGNIISLHHIFHDTTGYSLPDAVRILSALAESDLSEESINNFLSDDSRKKSGQRKFFTLLNRLMFKAATEQERYRPLEFFYRSSHRQISRFYSGDMNVFDKVIFFAGKPPVSIKKAFDVIREET